MADVIPFYQGIAGGSGDEGGGGAGGVGSTGWDGGGGGGAASAGFLAGLAGFFAALLPGLLAAFFVVLPAGLLAAFWPDGFFPPAFLPAAFLPALVPAVFPLGLDFPAGFFAIQRGSLLGAEVNPGDRQTRSLARVRLASPKRTVTNSPAARRRRSNFRT
jgi:hypothetical protein